MARSKVTLCTPDRQRGETLQLASGTTLLLGTEADPTKVDPTVAAGLPPFESHRVVSSRVSRQHALLWLSDDGLIGIRDLGSTNGTRVVATPGATVRVAASDGATLELALPPFKPDESATIPDAQWSEEKPLHEAVGAVLSQWLTQRGMLATIEVGGPEAASRCGTPLSVGSIDGRDVRVVLQGTEQVGWRAEYEQIAAYLHRQTVRRERLSAHGPDFICASPSFRQAHDQVCEAAERSLPLVLLGPSGSGKTRLAQCYHEHSAWRAGRFVEWSPSGTKDEALLSELFGHKRGAFTGAVEDKVGLVEAADNGTLFLDEIADLPLEAQARLLKFLDNGKYRRMGDVAERSAKVHVVCATNKPLHQMIWSMPGASIGQTFRSDLWYRLAGVVVHLEPLSKRPEDVTAFLATQKLADGGSLLAELKRPALEAILAHPWDGGVRELNNFCQRLPRTQGPTGIDHRAVEAALARGAAEPPERATRPTGRMTITKLDFDWDQLNSRAWQAFRGSQAPDSEVPLRSLETYVERYLKPLVVAEVCSREAGRGPDRGLLEERGLFAKVARRLQMAEPQRVKAYLGTYFEAYGAEEH